MRKRDEGAPRAETRVPRSRSPKDRGSRDDDVEDEGASAAGRSAGGSEETYWQEPAWEERSEDARAAGNKEGDEGDSKVTMSKRDLKVLADSLGGLATSLADTLDGLFSVAKMLKAQAEGLRTAQQHLLSLCDEVERDEAP